MVQCGSYAERLSQSSSFARMLENIYQQGQDCKESVALAEQQRSSRCVTLSEAENDELSSSLIALENKEEGSLSWRVYGDFLKAGVGLTVGILLIVGIFGVQEATAVFYSYWLAQWSSDENHRYQNLNNCTESSIRSIQKIKAMSDSEWSAYRRQRFYIYAGQ
jgi:hypothetical protein